MTWVGSGEKEGESFHVCFSAAQCWRGTGAEQGSAWSASIYLYIYTYKRVVCVYLSVCWFVCLLFIGHTTFVHFAALPPSGREQDQPSSRAAPRAGGKRMHSESTRAHAVHLFTALIYDAFQKQSRTRAHAVVYVTGEIFRKKTNMPLPKFSLQFAFSWSVYFSNRTESYSSQDEFAGPMESRRTRRPTFTAEERLERRREQDRRRHAERRARQRREHTQARRDVECLRCSQARA